MVVFILIFIIVIIAGVIAINIACVVIVIIITIIGSVIIIIINYHYSTGGVIVLNITMASPVPFGRVATNANTIAKIEMNSLTTIHCNIVP